MILKEDLYWILVKEVVAGTDSRLTLREIVLHLAKCRRIIHKICKKAFDDHVDSELFGRVRRGPLFTPFNGRYANLGDLRTSIELCPSDNMAVDWLSPSNDCVFRQIQHKGVNLSFLYYDKQGDSEPTQRCVVHTDVSEHEKCWTLLESSDNIKEVYWLLCQAAFFDRGTASIAEMTASVLASEGDKVMFSGDYGLDVKALLSDWDTFKTAYSLEFKVIDNPGITIDQLEHILHRIQPGFAGDPRTLLESKEENLSISFADILCFELRN